MILEALGNLEWLFSTLAEYHCGKAGQISRALKSGIAAGRNQKAAIFECLPAVVGRSDSEPRYLLSVEKTAGRINWHPSPLLRKSAKNRHARTNRIVNIR